MEDAANFTGVKNIDLGTLQALAADRAQWRHMIRNQRDVCGAGHSNDLGETGLLLVICMYVAWPSKIHSYKTAIFENNSLIVTLS